MTRCPVCGQERGDVHAEEHVRERKFVTLAQATLAVVKARLSLVDSYTRLAQLVRAMPAMTVEEKETYRDALAALEGAFRAPVS